MGDKVPTTQGSGGNSFQCGLWGALFLGLGAAFLMNTGYEHGINQSRKILRRHDKDVRRMFKREKQIYKEQRKKEQREKRENEVRTRWLWFKTHES